MQLTTVDLDKVHPDPDNIRDQAHDADIAALAEDIKAHGLLQPIVLYEATDADDMSPGHYLISAGHRRFFALLSLGHTTADAFVREHPTDDLDRLDLMAAENLQRRQLNPLEEAKLYKRYLTAGQTQAQIAARLHVTPTHVSECLSLLELSADVIRRLVAGEITFNAARKIAAAGRHSAGQARGDYGATHKLTNDPPRAKPVRRPVERFSDPRDILRRIKCTRCGTGALERPNETRCSAVREGRRVLFDRHEFPMEVAPADVEDVAS